MNGTCSCRQVEFRIDADIRDGYYCHCRDCQLHSGSAFQTLAVVPRKHFVLTSGKTKPFAKPAHGGQTMTREFCAACGTPLFLHSSRWDDIVMVSVSALDNPEAIKPAFQIWTSRENCWSRIPDGLASFPHGALDGK